MALSWLLIYARSVRRKEKSRRMGWTKQYNNEYPEMSISCCLCVVYVLYIFLVYVFSMSCLCNVYAPLIS